MQRIHDEVRETDIPRSLPARYRLQLFIAPADRSPVIAVATMIWAERKTTSIVDCAEDLATDVWQSLAKPVLPQWARPKRSLVWVIQIPPCSPVRGHPGWYKIPEQLIRVGMEWEGDRAPSQSPVWQRTTREEVEEVIGQELEPGVPSDGGVHPPRDARLEWMPPGPLSQTAQG